MDANISNSVVVSPSNVGYSDKLRMLELSPISHVSDSTKSDSINIIQRDFTTDVSRTCPPSINVTPSQETAIKTCIKLLPEFKIIVVKGESSSGKYTVANEVFRRTNAFVEYFDLCELAEQTTPEISNQHVVQYMKALLHRLQTKMSGANEPPLIKDKESPNVDTKFTKKRKFSSRVLSTKLSKISSKKSSKKSSEESSKESSILSAMREGETTSNHDEDEELSRQLQNVDLKRPDMSRKRQIESMSNMGIIYIRHYNRIADVLTDCYAKVRFLLALILKTFVETIPHNIRILITTQGCMLPEGLHWCIDLNMNRDDMDYVLVPYVNRNIITSNEKDYILKISKVIPVGRLLYCLRYATAMSDPLSSNKNNRNTEQACDPTKLDPSQDLRSQEKNPFIEYFRKALGRFSGSTVDVEKDVPKPVPEDDLVGVEEIIDAIIVSVINPMKLGISGVPMKKGLLLCGPPGTGKTSIGRWLAHQIKGKFYLIGGEAGINGSSLIDTFELTVRKARENAPAVIFIDDCDVLFEHDDTYRAFLTILDGIETNKREGVCVVLTCMNLRNIPSSLLRGGRLEMTLITKLPDRKKIQIILQQSLNKMCQTLVEYDVNIGNEISNRVTIDFITNLSHRMTGWNCADIHRCVNDVLRLIISGKGIDIVEMFQKCIRQIQEQYLLCGKCESTNVDDRPHDAYIM
ncbi:AAA family ATPase [uncultured virus]|nr:AAA family ATPase [uncultured virus]